MPHDVTLIATIAAAFGLALVTGFAATLLRLPPLVGYLVAGVMIGPATPGFVADIGLAGQLAEIGVMLLMFGVGLHFSLADLLAVRRIALPGAVVQIMVAVLMGMGTAMAWGWSIGAGLVFGLCLSVASTVVLLRALEARGALQSIDGRIAVGWLVVEDLVMVLVLVLLPPLAGVIAGGGAGSSAAGAAASPSPTVLWATLGLTLLKVGAFVLFMAVVGYRALPRVLWWIARSGSRELFTLCVIAAAVGVAFGAAKLFDVSFALGAFFAGMMMRESEFSRRAADESLPLRDAFAVLFFVSVGMLFDPSVIWTQPGRLLAVVAIILVGKTIAAVAIVLIFRYSLNTALTVGASLAQIGEFSFILAGLGVALGLLPEEGRSLILAAAVISIAANSALFAAIEPLRARLQRHRALDPERAPDDDPLAQLPMATDPALLNGQVVLAGYDDVAARVAELLRARGMAFVVADPNRETVEDLRRRGVPAVSGELERPEVLVQAHVARAAVLVIATDDRLDAGLIMATARALNPDIHVVLRAHSDEEAGLLRQEGLGTVFLAEQELARGITEHIGALRGSPVSAGNAA
jgi:CPA2 family monovalent cation:H+ antiporter-2